MTDDRKTVSLDDLKRYRSLERRIAILKELIKKQEASIAYEAARRTRMNADARKDRVGATSRVDKLKETEHVLEGFIDEAVEMADSIICFIQSKKEPESEILYYRYVQGLSWRAVASRVHLSVDRCQHINGEIFKRQK